MPYKPRHRSRLAVLVGAVLLLRALISGIAVAQPLPASADTPARIGNIWAGFDHQPTQSQVQSAERAGSIAPSAQEQSREAQIVQQLDHELLNNDGVGP